MDTLLKAANEAGKPLKIEHNNYGHLYFKYGKGGKLPAMLKGVFTSYKEAETMLNRYLESLSKPVEEKESAKS